MIRTCSGGVDGTLCHAARTGGSLAGEDLERSQLAAELKDALRIAARWAPGAPVRYEKMRVLHVTLLAIYV